MSKTRDRRSDRCPKKSDPDPKIDTKLNTDEDRSLFPAAVEEDSPLAAALGHVAGLEDTEDQKDPTLLIKENVIRGLDRGPTTKGVLQLSGRHHLGELTELDLLLNFGLKALLRKRPGQALRVLIGKL